MTTVTLSAHHLRLMPLPVPEGGSKDDRGSVLIIAGSVEVPGAAALTATAALRAGAGRLQIATVRTAAISLGIAMPEAMIIGCPETNLGGMHVSASKRLVEASAKASAVIVGPGMTQESDTLEIVLDVLRGSARAAVLLDAAALCDLRRNAAALRSCGKPIVITPHAGEMARLLETDRDIIERDPLTAARKAAELLGVTVVMKGARTFIVTPTGMSLRYDGGGVGLATSGSGDVLAGVIGGLLARGADPEVATAWGVFLHGEAGIELSRKQGPVGFLARELSGEIPRLLAVTMGHEA